MKASTVLESEIIEILKLQDSCPICYAKSKAVDSWIYGAFTNLLHNEDARTKLREGGLCRYHSARITEMARENSDIGSLAVTVIFKEMLLEQKRMLKGDARKGFFRRNRESNIGNCHLCRIASDTETRYLKGFYGFLYSESIRRMYEESTNVFCIDHSESLFKVLRTSESQWFEEVQNKKIGLLLSDLELYIGRHDYRNSEPIGEEKKAWLIASKIIGQL